MLIELNGLSESLQSYATYGMESLLLYFQVAIASEKFQELREWMEVSEHYLSRDSLLRKWARIVEQWHGTMENKTIAVLQEFLKATFEFLSEIRNSSLVSLVHFMRGQAMVNSLEWKSHYQPSQIIKK